jgi:hypothetical protein
MMDKIREGYTPLLQLMTNDLKGRFGTGLITTKCLNTAVLIMYLSGGERGLQEAFRCNVDRVIPRYHGVFDKRVLADSQSQNLIESLLMKRKERRLHYVMLTDCDMGHGVIFPGHVFVIETDENDETHMHQSYIFKYDMDTQVREYSNNTSKRSRAWVSRFCRELVTFTHKDTWDAACVRFWSFLTHVDTHKYVGHDKSRVYLCYNSIDAADADRNFEGYLARKLIECRNKLMAEPESRNEIYGDASLYVRGMENGARPLTTGEMDEYLGGVSLRDTLPPTLPKKNI